MQKALPLAVRACTEDVQAEAKRFSWERKGFRGISKLLMQLPNLERDFFF